jgi:sugar lactone lactonase YvrE
MDNNSVFRVYLQTSEGYVESSPAMVSVSGSGARMFAGAFEKYPSFNPIFDTRWTVNAIAADASGKFYATYEDRTYSFTAAGVSTALGATRCTDGIGIVTDKAGTIYRACGPAIVKVGAAGAVTLFAGSFSAAGAVDGAALAARFRAISAMALGADGAMFVSDNGSGTIRRIAPDGTVSTLAGGPRTGAAVDGTGAAARFVDMHGIAVDSQRNIYVTDANSVRKVTSAGVVSTIAGDPAAKGSANGIGAVARFSSPSGLAVDAAGTLYVADKGNFSIRKVVPSGQVSTLAGSPEQRGSGDGFGPYASFNAPDAMTLDASGNLLVADVDSGTIRKVTPAGSVTTVIGTPNITRSSGSIDGWGQEARFRDPKGLAIDETGNLYVADSLNHAIRKVSPAGMVSTLAGSPLVNGIADGIGKQASLRLPTVVTLAGNGVVYVHDTLSDPKLNLIRRIGPDGAVTTVEIPRDPLNTTADGIVVAPMHKLIAANAKGDLFVYSVIVRDGACLPAQGCVPLARVTLRKIGQDGTAITLFTDKTPHPGTGRTMDYSTFRGMAADGSGNVYLTDIANHVVLKVTSAGAISIFAGTVGVSGSSDGIGAAARLAWPLHLTTDAAGNVYVADSDSSTVRKITAGGSVTTLAGTPYKYGDASGPLPGELSEIKGIAVDASGAVYVTQDNGIVKIVQP